MKNYKWLVVCILLVCYLPSKSQQKDNSSQQDTTYQLSDFECFAKKDMSEIMPPQKLNTEALQSINSQSVADAVRYFSGVQVKDYGGIGGLKTINIRSMGTTQMGVFYDGIQVGNAQNGQIDLGRFSLDNVESISIYNGQKSSHLQSAKDFGSAGTVYIRSKRPILSKEKPFYLKARLNGGSFGLFNPSLIYQQRLAEDISLSTSIDFQTANGHYKFTRYDTTLIRQNSDITAFRAEASVFGLTERGDWKVQIYNYNSNRGLAGYIARNLYTNSDRQWDNNFFLQSSLKQTFGKYSFLINAKYSNDYLHYISPDTITLYYNDRYRQQELYLSIANGYSPFKWLNLSLSTDYQYNHLFADTRQFKFPTRHSIFVATSANLRLRKFSLQTSILMNMIKDFVKDDSPEPQINFSPALIATYSPFKHFPLTFRGFIKRSFRMPTFNDLYYTGLIPKKLKPEFVSQVDLGVEYVLLSGKRWLKSLSTNIDAYYNEVTDKIVAVPSSSTFRWSMENLGFVKIYGVDFSMNAVTRISRSLYLNLLANYTYQNARDYTDYKSPFFGDLIPYTPLHSFTAAFNIKYKQLHFNYCTIYTGERYNSYANTKANYVQPWYTHDASLGYKFEVRGKGTLSTNIDINNLFNQQYDVVSGYPMPGTNFKVSLIWEM